ncbi:Calbindin [Cichlidogyrus casuarinus]|uniref:Calbindin n=1 Tax=Cichlidogyrus casuarinus TaxID=1844966 RepID=A0ABD2QJC8_9PLAT
MAQTSLKSRNFFEQFCDTDNKIKKLTATQFAEVWNHYDKDGNGYIEGEELDEFLEQFNQLSFSSDAQVIVWIGINNIFPQSFNKDRLAKIREDFLKQYDENKDRKIDISELANILPEDENFLLLFRRASVVKSSQQFMRIWKQFDKNHNGFIDASEMEAFLESLSNSEGENCNKAKLTEYAKTIVNLFDTNKDGKLQLSELAKLLPTEENHLSNPLVKSADKISADEIDKVFDHYDKDGNGTIEDEEFEGFMKDFLDTLKESYTIEDLDKYKQVILNEWDVNHDGKISREELKMILLQHSKVCSEIAPK